MSCYNKNNDDCFLSDTCIMSVKMQRRPKMERTLECKHIQNANLYDFRGQWNHVKKSVSVIGNVDLIVAHEVTFPQPPLPLVDNVLANVLMGYVCTGQSKPNTFWRWSWYDSSQISRRRMLPCEPRASQLWDFDWLNQTQPISNTSKRNGEYQHCSAQYWHLHAYCKSTNLFLKWIFSQRTYPDRRRKAFAIESDSEVLWFGPNLFHDVVEELGLLFLFRQDTI